MNVFTKPGRTAATFKHGVLTVRLPKVSRARNVSIQVEPGT